MNELCRKIIPPLTSALHKGQIGRICIVGGCEAYTGAPYFAGIAALRLGADLVHIMCTPCAAIPIKCYSPDLMVLPILCPEKFNEFHEWIHKMHCIVFGPGLGRDPKNLKIVAEWVNIAKENNIPVIIDADGMFLVTENPSLIKGYQDAILTPNVIEFERLYHALEDVKPQRPCTDLEIITLSKNLGCSIVCKGQVDTICTAGHVLKCTAKGSNRRVGGQGDILSGSLGLFAHWAKSSRELSTDIPYQSIAGYAACSVTKCANSLTFDEKGRSMITSDMIAKLYPSLLRFIAEEDESANY